MKSRICFQTKLKELAKLINSQFPERLNYRRFSNNFHKKIALDFDLLELDSTHQGGGWCVEGV